MDTFLLFCWSRNTLSRARPNASLWRARKLLVLGRKCDHVTYCFTWHRHWRGFLCCVVLSVSSLHGHCSFTTFRCGTSWTKHCMVKTCRITGTIATRQVDAKVELASTFCNDYSPWMVSLRSLWSQQYRQLRRLGKGHWRVRYSKNFW